MYIFLTVKKLREGPIDEMGIQFNEWMQNLKNLKYQSLSDKTGMIQLLLETNDKSQIILSDYEYVEKFLLGAGYKITQKKIKL